MMNKEKFICFYTSLTKFLKESNSLAKNNVLNSEYILNYSGYGWEAVEKALSLSFNQDQIDWIYWWFFEKPHIKTNAKAFDAKGNTIPTETIDDLWNLIKDYDS